MSGDMVAAGLGQIICVFIILYCYDVLLQCHSGCSFYVVWRHFMPYLCFLGQLVRSSLFLLYSHTMDTPARYWTHENHEGRRTIKCRLSLYRLLLLLNVAFITLMILIDAFGVGFSIDNGGSAVGKGTLTLVRFCKDDYSALWYAALLFSQTVLCLLHVFEFSSFSAKACEERDILYRYGSSASSRDVPAHLRQRHQARKRDGAAAAVSVPPRCVTPSNLTGNDDNV